MIHYKKGPRRSRYSPCFMPPRPARRIGAESAGLFFSILPSSCGPSCAGQSPDFMLSSSGSRETLSLTFLHKDKARAGARVGVRLAGYRPGRRARLFRAPELSLSFFFRSPPTVLQRARLSRDCCFFFSMALRARVPRVFFRSFFFCCSVASLQLVACRRACCACLCARAHGRARFLLGSAWI